MFKNNIVDSDRVLYTPSPFAKKSLYYLQEAGILTAKQPHVSKRENLKSLLFFIVLEGSGTLTYRQQTYNLRAGSCVFISCEEPYSHETSTDLWTLRWVHFHGTAVDDIYAKYTERGGLPAFTPNDPSSYHTLLLDIFTVAKSDDHLRDMRLNEKLASLMTMCMKETKWPKTQAITPKSLPADVLSYLDNHYAEKITLEDLSARFVYSREYIAKSFFKHYGVTITGYLKNVRIGHAKELLRFSDLSMEEIALRCGFTNGSYFSRAFKKSERMSPTEYRDNW